MISLLRRWLPKPQPIPATLLAAERFVIARFEPVAGSDTRAQASLALEGSSPFPPSQLLQGLVRSANGSEGLAYAAHRRAFGGDASGWPAESPVVPEFLALLGERPEAGGVIVHTDALRSLALAWRAGESLPSGMASLPAEDGPASTAAAEAAAAAGLEEGWTAVEMSGALTGLRTEAGLELRRAGGPAYLIAPRMVDDLDVRDPAFLEARQRQERWDLRTWRAAQVAVAAILLAGIADLSGLWLASEADRIRAQVSDDSARVRELEGLNAVAGKVDDLGRNRPLPFEMLTVANSHRPSATTFTAITHKGGTALEIEARTSNAADVGAFEQALAADAHVAKAETRSIQGREGVTSFSLTVTFKPDVLRQASQETP